MSVPFNLSRVLEKSSSIEGFQIIKDAFPIEPKQTERIITYADAVFSSLDSLVDDYSDWPEDQGFGSSDMTYVYKSFIDNMIRMANLSGKYQTDFKPYLKVVEYSECDHHNRIQKIESGI